MKTPQKRREMMERAAEQNLACVQGDEYFWKRGCGPEDVDWDRPMEDEQEEHNEQPN
jgi:hypothetical protein